MTGSRQQGKSEPSTTWRFVLGVALKAALLFVACNVVFVALEPLEALGAISLYNRIIPGRERLPYGENPAESYNISLYNVPAMIASHRVEQPKAPDEYRVLIIGDSGTWGWLLDNEDTLAGEINVGEYVTENDRRVVAYNLGYPIMSLTKDLMLLDAAMQYEPDLIVWPVTAESFPRDRQLTPPLLHNNASRVRALIKDYRLNLDADDPRFVEPDFIGRTIVGQRRALADLLRLQWVGVSWAATRIDRAIPAEVTLRQSDFDEDVSWHDYTEPVRLTGNDLAFDVLAAGVERAGDVPMLIVNEPMYISSGRNSDLRYNSFYPRWAYDQYRALLAEAADKNGWRYLDVWDSIAPEEFTDTPVHLTPEGSAQFAQRVAAAILETANE
ncbi:MAG TPA: SGNH/GDSL hydrolase family protein [Anaerolineae bacterium]|nr:SGNH/GDSL hydrolase family protein [Anaerolineae bacterium]